MKIKVFILVMAILMLVGCGSTGSGISKVEDTNDGNGTPTVKIPDVNATPKTMLSAQYLLDTKGIEGITYSCEDNTTGTTSKDGNFTYAKDVSKVCMFWINNIPLTAVNTANILAGDIVDPSDNAKKILLSLDDDANASNGIKVLPEVVTTLNGKLKRVPDTDAELVAMVGYISGIAGYNGRAFTNTPVSVKIIGFKTDKKYLLGEMVSLDTNITGVSTNGLTYSWKENNAVVGTDSNYSTSTFSVGTHTINVTVKDTNSKKYGEDSVTITVSDYLVTVKPTKKVYKTDENVTLEVNVTGTVATLGYTWSDKHTAWKDLDLKAEGAVGIADNLSTFTTDKLTKKFTVGHHMVTLKVSANNSDKNATFDFDVIDDSDFNITKLTTNNDEVIVQKSTNLMWVNEHNKSKKKCAKIHGDDGNLTLFAKELKVAKTFCQNLDFGGFAGTWRTPTKIEIKIFIDTTIASNISLAYDAKCARLLATNGGNLDLNSSYATVTTRYIDTTSGVVSADGNLTPNIGLRCVRTLP